MISQNYKTEFIEFLLDAGVLKFGDFIAKSGRKLPYFINAGDIKTGKQIERLGEFYAQCYLDKIGADKNTVLYGPAYKGIPIAVAAAAALAKQRTTAKAAFSSASFRRTAKRSSSWKT